MRVVRNKAELREALEPARRQERTIGLVPTMGYLHEGHLSLLRAARRRCDVVVMSLFVNPAQFGRGEDLESYPRDEARDHELAEQEGVDLIYAPPVEEVYPGGLRDQRRGGRGADRGALRRSRPARRRSLPRRHHRGREAAQLGRAQTSPSSAKRTPSRRS